MNMSKKDWKEFLSVCFSIKNEKTFHEFFDFFLTPQEKEALITRYLLTQALLKKEKPQRAIAADLNISIAKITRGSNALKSISSNLRNFLASLK